MNRLGSFISDSLFVYAFVRPSVRLPCEQGRLKKARWRGYLPSIRRAEPRLIRRLAWRKLLKKVKAKTCVVTIGCVELCPNIRFQMKVSATVRTKMVA